MRGARSQPGESTTTNNVRTAVWDTKHRKSSQRRRQPASTQLSERQGTQTPSLAPRAPPSRLKPRMEKQKAVVFLRERIWGAGHAHVLSRMAHPVLVKALRTLRVVPQIRVPETTERMVSSLMRSGERVHVVQLLQGCVQMATDDVRWRQGLSVPRAEQKARLSV